MADTAHDAPINDLNTTPLIDVLLVLLVMFIITIPLQTHQVGLDLPAPKGPDVPFDSVRNRITIGADNVIRWNEAAVSEAQLRKLLARTMAMGIEPALDLKPAAEARYLLVDAVIADIKRARVTKLALPGNEAYGVF